MIVKPTTVDIGTEWNLEKNMSVSTRPRIPVDIGTEWNLETFSDCF